MVFYISGRKPPRGWLSLSRASAMSQLLLLLVLAVLRLVRVFGMVPAVVL